MAVNVSHWEQCDELVERVYAEFGHCEVLINNAGLSPLYPDLTSVTEELYDKTHAVNAKGPFRLATLVGTRMFDGRRWFDHQRVDRGLVATRRARPARTRWRRRGSTR